MKRRLAPVGILLVAVLIVSCSDSGGSSGTSEKAGAIAVRADAATIPVDRLVGELRTIAANPRLAASLKKEDEKLVPRPDTINADLAQSYLTMVVQQTFIDREFARRKLKVDPKTRAASARKAALIFYSQKIFDAFPQKFRQLQVSRQMRNDALQRALGPKAEPTEAELRDLYTQVEKLCTTGKAVSNVWVKSKAKADAIAAELAQGADFSTLARERSENEETAARDGLLTCIGSVQYNGYPAEYRGAAESLAVGETSAPFRSDDGYAMVKILPMTYETMLPLVVEEFHRKQLSPLAAFLTRAMYDAKPFTVQKRFGNVVRTSTFVALTPRLGPVDLSE